VLILVVVLLLAGAVTQLHRARQRAREANLESDLDEALGAGVTTPLEAQGHTRVLLGAAWQDSPMRLRQAGGRALISLERRGRRVDLLDDGERLWRLTAPADALGLSTRKIDWALLRRNYTLRPAPNRTIAGREAGGLRVVRRRSGRTAEAFWIDQPQRLILARRSYDADGHLVSETELTQVRDAAQAEKALAEATAHLPKPVPERPLTDAEFAERAGFAPLRPAYVPEGYEEVGLFGQTCPHGRTYAELRYFDGLRVMSIFERPGGGPGGGQGRGFGHGRGQKAHAETAEPVLVDEGQAKTVRVRRGAVRVFVTADLTQQEILRVVNSLP